MQSLVSFLQDCCLGKKQVHRNLSVFPVLFPDVRKPYYLTLEQAIDSEVLVVTEVDAAGSVGRLRLRNHSREPILLVEGEELKGAKQYPTTAGVFIGSSSRWEPCLQSTAG